MVIMVKIVKGFRKGDKMAREWQQTKQKEYVMPDTVYYQSLWAVRDLERMEKRLNELDENRGEREKSGSFVHEQANTSPLWQPTEEHAMEKVILEERVKAIHNALSIVPDIYRPYILSNIIQKKTGSSFPNKFWKVWKQRFLYYVAKNLSLM